MTCATCERLRQQWASSATACLSTGAEAAAASAEQDRSRRADIAAVLRDAYILQSERDEAVDRYQAIWRVSNEAQ